MGEAGEFNDRMMEKVGFDLSRVRYTNAVRCRPPNNRIPSREAIKACKPALIAEIEHCKPKVVLVEGASALKSLGKGGTIAENRGRWFARGEQFYVPTWRPIDLIRSKSKTQLREFVDDLNTALEIVREGRPKIHLPDVHICRTITEVREEMGLILDGRPKKVAFDFEATGLRPERPDFQVLSCSFSWGEGYGPPVDNLPYHTFVIPLYHYQSPLSISEREESLELIREFARALYITKIVQNVFYEFQVLWSSLRVEMLGKVLDTMCLDAQRDERASHSLETMSWLTPWKGWKELSEAPLRAMKSKDRKFGNIPLITYKQVEDTEATREAHIAYQQSLREYLEPLDTKAVEIGKRYLLRLIKKVQKSGGGQEEEELALQIAEKKIETLQRLIRLKRRWTEKKPDGTKIIHLKPVDPGRVMVDTDVINGGLALYNGADSHGTRFLEEKIQTPAVLKRGTMGVYDKILEPSFGPLSKMMARGVKVDRVFLTHAQLHLQQALSQIETKLLKRPELEDWPDFNWNSPQQVAELLYNRLGYRLTGKEYESTGGIKMTEDSDVPIPSVDEEALANMAKKYKGIPAIIQKGRKLGKTKGTYVDSYLETKKGKEAHIQADDRVHTEYTIIPVTGRLSCIHAGTELETDKGVFKISDLEQYRNHRTYRILTHKHRWRRILRVFPKGKDEMFEVLLANGAKITCTKKHRFLTPSGWKSLANLEVGSEVTTAPSDRGGVLPDRNQGRVGVSGSQQDSQRQSEGLLRQRQELQEEVLPPTRSNHQKKDEEKCLVASPPREDVCHSLSEGRTHMGGGTKEVRNPSRNLPSLQKQVLPEVRGGTQATPKQAACEADVWQQERSKAASSSHTGQGETRNRAEARNHNPEDRKGYGLQRVSSSEEHRIPRYPGQHVRQTSELRGKPQSPPTGKVGVTQPWNSGDSKGFDHGDCRRLLQPPVPSLSPTPPTLVVHAETGESQREVLQEEGEAIHLLEQQSLRGDGGAGSGRPWNSVHAPGNSGAHSPWSNDGGLPNSRKALLGNRRRVPQDQRGQSQRFQEGEKNPGIEYPASTGNNQGCRAETGRGNRENPEGFGVSAIASIHSVGVSTVWDLSVEDDESYVAQGFINHNSRSPNLQNIGHSPLILEATESELKDLVEELGEEFLIKQGWQKADKARNKGEPKEIFRAPGCDFLLLKDGSIKKGIMIKKAFIPTWEGGFLVDADYAGIELRVLASITKCPQLIIDLTSTIMVHGKPVYGDVHRMTASTIFKKAPQDITDEERQKAKKSLFSIIYGKGIPGLAEELEISTREAAKIVNGIFARYPEVKYYIEACHNFIRANGFVQAINERIRGFPEVWSTNLGLISGCFREGFNHEVQGPASDLTLMALVRVWNFLEENGFKSRPCLIVHDNLTIDCPPEEKDAVYEITKTIMEDKPPWMLVPARVDIRAVRSWGDAKG